MSKYTSGGVMSGLHPAASAITRALGLEPQEVLNIEFSLKPQSIAIVTVQMLLTVDQAEEIATVLKQFELVQRPLSEHEQFVHNVDADGKPL